MDAVVGLGEGHEFDRAGESLAAPGSSGDSYSAGTSQVM